MNPAEITELCLTARSRGWTRTQVREVLVAHRASWKNRRITQVPAENLRRLDSALRHHPSWWKCAKSWCAQLSKMGFQYQEVATACLNLEMPPPSMMSREWREQVMQMLGDRASELRFAIEEVRAAKQAQRRQRKAA